MTAQVENRDGGPELYIERDNVFYGAWGGKQIAIIDTDNPNRGSVILFRTDLSPVYLTNTSLLVADGGFVVRPNFPDKKEPSLSEYEFAQMTAMLREFGFVTRF